jgi:hypothetical protein
MRASTRFVPVIGTFPLAVGLLLQLYGANYGQSGEWCEISYRKAISGFVIGLLPLLIWILTKRSRYRNVLSCATALLSLAYLSQFSFVIFGYGYTPTFCRIGVVEVAIFFAGPHVSSIIYWLFFDPQNSRE